MKFKITIVSCLLISSLLSTQTLKAQFFNYLSEESNYLRGDVKSEAGGLSFTYRLQDDSTLALKTLLIRADDNGQIIWAKETGSNFGTYTIAADTSVIITGGGSTTAGNRFAILQKIDKTGTIIWKKSLKISFADVGLGNIMISTNNTIFATLTRSSFISNTYYSKAAVVAYDMNGQMMWTTHFGCSGLTTENSFSRTILASNGDFIGVVDIRGASGAPANGMMVTRISPQGTVRFTKYIDFKDTHNQLSVTGLVETSTNEIIFGGRLMTDQISKYTNTMWLGKLDSVGNMVQQKVYSGGVKVGEQLHSLRYDDGKLFAYLHHYAPFDSVATSVWMGIINEQTLAFTKQNATDLEVNPEDPYGNVSNSFCITSDGKPTVAAGFYCKEKDRYFPLMQQWSSSLTSSCAALDRVQPILDSAAIYTAVDYTPQGSFTVAYEDDTSIISLTDIVFPVVNNLCDGCNATTGISKVKQEILFHIYPNPSDGHYFIDFEQSLLTAQFTVTNILGATVYQAKLKNSHQVIDLSTQPSGIYFIRIHLKDGRLISSKLIKD